MEDLFSAKALVEGEKRMNEKYQSGEIDLGNDFHSYRCFREGKELKIELHNIVGENVECYAKIEKRVFDKYHRSPIRYIGDMGRRIRISCE